MSGIEKIAGKALEEAAKESEGLLKTLFKEYLSELGGKMADNMRFKRYKNSLKILNDVNKLIKEKNIEPKSVPLKVLSPLLEFSSLEEEPTIQKMWSNLTVDILERDEDSMFQQNAISALNKISIKEAEIIKHLYQDFKININQVRKSKDVSLDEMEAYINAILFSLSQLEKELNVSRQKLNYRISNLIGLN